MTEVLKIMDDQMLKWVAELDALYENRKKLDRTIYELEQFIEAARTFKKATQRERICDDS